MSRIEIPDALLFKSFLGETTNDETDDTRYNTLGDACRFFIGYSFNEYRPLNGKIAEARVWSVASRRIVCLGLFPETDCGTGCFEIRMCQFPNISKY